MTKFTPFSKPKKKKKHYGPKDDHKAPAYMHRLTTGAWQAAATAKHLQKI